MPLLLGSFGAALAAVSFGSYYTLKAPDRKMRSALQIFFAQTEQKVKILEVRPDAAAVELPLGMSSKTFMENIEPLELMFGRPVRIKHLAKRVYAIQTAEAPLSTYIPYNEHMHSRKYCVPFFHTFGTHWIDFSDGVSTHMLIGGASRMGKSILLRMMIIHLLLKSKGKITFYVLDDKIADLFVFDGVPQIIQGKTVDQGIKHIEAIKKVMEEREAILEANRASGKANTYDLPPIFMVVDEYHMFSDKDKGDPKHAEKQQFQNLMRELAARSGYLNIHLILASQRTDVNETFPPLVRQNMGCRLAFYCNGEENSKMIIGSSEAANIDATKGRAIINDGTRLVEVQIPYIDDHMAKELLKRYVKPAANKVSNREADTSEPEGEGQPDTGTSLQFPGVDAGTDREDGIPEQQPADNSSQPSPPPPKTRKPRNPNSTTKG